MLRALVVISLFAVMGCGSSLPTPATVAQPESAFVAVPFPPPPARPEFVPEAPNASAVWIDGEWQWKRTRWAWLYGRWVEPPEGAQWSPWSWRRDALGQLHYAPGTWRGERGAAIAHPKPLRLANADEGDVLEDAGILEDVGRNRVAGSARRWRGPSPSPCRHPADIDDDVAPEKEEGTSVDQDGAQDGGARGGAQGEDDCGAEPPGDDRREETPGDSSAPSP